MGDIPIINIKKLQQNQDMTAKQKQIIQAAIELISEKGFASTSTSEIAKRAGVAEGTIFKHYKTKKDLLLSIIDPATLQFFAPIFADDFVKQVFDKKYSTLNDFLYQFIENRLHFLKENLPIAKIILQELAFQPEVQMAYKREFMEKVYPSISLILDYFKEAGELRQLDNEQLLRLMTPPIIGFLLSRFIIQAEKDWNDNQEIKQIVMFITRGLRP